MKKSNYLLALLFIFTTLAQTAQVLHPVKDNIACLWGFKNDAGKWVVAPKYKMLNDNYKGFLMVMYADK